MNLRDLIAAAGAQAKKSGFRTPGFVRPVAEHVALITTEIGEMYEEHRDGHLPTEHWYEYTEADGSKTVLPVRERREEREGVIAYVLGKPIGIPAELGDIVIRACDMAEEHGIDLVAAISEKMIYNATRPLKHGRQS